MYAQLLPGQQSIQTSREQDALTFPALLPAVQTEELPDPFNSIPSSPLTRGFKKLTILLLGSISKCFETSKHSRESLFS